MSLFGTDLVVPQMKKINVGEGIAFHGASRPSPVRVPLWVVDNVH